MIITLENDFHTTSARVRVQGSLPYTLTRHQARRATRALCGMSDCQCGVVWTNDGRGPVVAMGSAGIVESRLGAESITILTDPSQKNPTTLGTLLETLQILDKLTPLR